MLPLAALATFILMRGLRAVGQPDEPGRAGHRHRHAGGRAVVVVENVETSRRRRQPRRPAAAAPLVFRAAREVAAPVTAGIVIIIIVSFCRCLTLQGLEGKMFSRWR